MPVDYRVRSIPTDSRAVEFSVSPAVRYTVSRHFLAIKINQCSEIPAISRIRLRTGRVRQNAKFRGVGSRSGKRHSSCETTSALASRPGTRCVCSVLAGATTLSGSVCDPRSKVCVVFPGTGEIANRADLH